MWDLRLPLAFEVPLTRPEQHVTPPPTLLHELAAAAKPYTLRAERTPHSMMPDLVFSYPWDGRVVARLRWFEAEGEAPFLRTVIPAEVSREDQLEVERHIEEHVIPVILRRFSYAAWISLTDLQPPP